jgi:tetratricopeptide (TPR) repeat protein
VERVAFLSIDNLSGDESLSWMSLAVPSIASAQLAGVGRILPLRADTSRDAAAVGATQLVHGYFDRRKGALHFEFSIEDAVSHAMRAVPTEGDALHAAAAIASAVDSGAKPFSTANAEAAQAWGKQAFERAIQLDPDFGTAWRDLIQSRAAKPAEAAELAGKALARQGLRSSMERAQIALLSGQLAGDPSAIGKASAELVRLMPNDGEPLRRVAELETNARNFSHAVELYQTYLRLEPDDALALNLLGYVQFYAGDLAGARKSFEEYGRRPGQAPNALDSQGEILFMAGQFGEAERYFLRAHEVNPAMLDGADLQKAAYAHWLGGDLKGADAIFEKYLQYRTDHADQTVTWRRAGWEFATGRVSEAKDHLKGVVGPTAQMARGQLQVFDNSAKVIESLTKDLAALEQSYRRTPPSADGLVRVLYARGLWQAGKKTEAQRLAAWWPLPESGDASLQPLLYPMYLELKKELAK